MYRIRFHGRGGQGVKTASRILGTALFLEGFQVQDAPRYGAERRGAPISAFVRADHDPIKERGVINNPDLVVVVDETLLPLPVAGVCAGGWEKSILLFLQGRQGIDWKERLDWPGVLLPVELVNGSAGGADKGTAAVTAVGAAARLLGVISASTLRQAVAAELEHLHHAALALNLEVALSAFNRLNPEELPSIDGGERPWSPPARPNWIDPRPAGAFCGTATIYRAQTSSLLKTGLWRTERPVIDRGLCKRCWWICSTFCPDGAVSQGEGGMPKIDYEHCKGCLICQNQCPSHAITHLPEGQADKAVNQ